MLLFPEGKRRTEARLEESRKYALEHNMEPFKHHLFPRTKGFLAVLPILKKHCDSIVSLNISYEEHVFDVKLTDFMFGKKFHGHIHAKRIPMSEVPENEEAATQFLYDLFREKDQLQEDFSIHKNFTESTNLKPIELKPKLWVLINTMFWMLSLLIPLSIHFVSLLIDGFYLNFLIKIGIIVLIGNFIQI